MTEKQYSIKELKEIGEALGLTTKRARTRWYGYVHRTGCSS
jgi:hypothetical protein